MPGPKSSAIIRMTFGFSGALIATVVAQASRNKMVYNFIMSDWLIFLEEQPLGDKVEEREPERWLFRIL